MPTIENFIDGALVDDAHSFGCVWDVRGFRPRAESPCRSYASQELETKEGHAVTKRILIPVDERAASESLLSLIADSARSAGSTIRLLDVKPVPDNVVSDYGRVIAYASQEMSRLDDEGQRYLDGVAAAFPDVPVERVVRFGDPAEEALLEAEAWNADLIAVPSDQRTWTGRLRRGSVADTLYRKSPVPVLVYRPH